MTMVRKKLIEVSIPLEAINAASAHEKMPGIGPHPRGLHLWWARRPLAACRAVLFAQLVDDPSSWPDRFPTEEEQDAERKRLHKVVERLVPWDASKDSSILDEARWEIARSVAWGLGEEPPLQSDARATLDYLQTKAPPVYDPFSGGGAIPLEAQRLGLRAYGSDLNPVAVLIGKAVVEIPPKFAGMPPVNPKAQSKLKRGGRWNSKGVQGLADDVRNYGHWMLDEAEKRIGHLYPKIKLPNGSDGTIVAWLWARTVRSPDPAAKGARVPLISSFLLSTKGGRRAWVEPQLDPSSRDGFRFIVNTGQLSKDDEERLKNGTKTGRGHFACILTGSAITGEHIKSEADAGFLGARLMAIVVSTSKGRLYLAPTKEQEDAAAIKRPDVPEIASEIPYDPRALTPVLYQLDRWDKLFTARQLTALATLSDLVHEVRAQVLDAAHAAGLEPGRPLQDGGSGATAYADAVATYLAFAIDRSADFGNSVTRWSQSNEKVMNLFGRSAVPMVWDFTEANTLAEVVGGFAPAFSFIADCMETLPALTPAEIYSLDAAKNSFPVRPVVISTDPPYYDNIGYADLSDFFYVWLRRSLAGIWPDLFRRIVTPKAEELVAASYRHGGKTKAEAFFMKGMGEALQAIRNISTDGEPLAIYYAFKQSEVAADGVTSAGWASFLQAVVDAGLAVDGTWPLRSEQSGRMRGMGSNALASSIVLVCRRHSTTAPVVTRAEFIRTLKHELPDAIDDIRKAGVGPVDMQQSIIGPGMGVFTRYAKVLESDDSAMKVRTALSLINRVWEEIENELDANFDPETQVALAWFATYGFDVKPSGELIGVANAKNISDRVLFDTGVFKNMHGRTALTPRAELPMNWSPSADKSVTVWECVQHTARVLNAPDGGGEAAAQLVAQMGPKAADARALAYRLYEVCSQKGWASEALVYNELAQEWARLADIAINMTSATRSTPGQGAFTFDEGAA